MESYRGMGWVGGGAMRLESPELVKATQHSVTFEIFGEGSLVENSDR